MCVCYRTKTAVASGTHGLLNKLTLAEHRNGICDHKWYLCRNAVYGYQNQLLLDAFLFPLSKLTSNFHSESHKPFPSAGWAFLLDGEAGMLRSDLEGEAAALAFALACADLTGD